MLDAGYPAALGLIPEQLELLKRWNARRSPVRPLLVALGGSLGGLLGLALMRVLVHGL